MQLLKLVQLLLAWTLGSQALSAQQPTCAKIPPDTPIQPIGVFSNMRFTEEHAYGYSVQLWRAGHCLVGLFDAAEGLAGDTPVGQLAVTRYDPRSGSLSFSAKLTIGVTMTGESDARVPSREEFQFDGRLRSKLLQGTLVRLDRLHPQVGPVRESVSLRTAPDQSETMIQAPTYGAWIETIKPILQARGPRW
jgi:hypothetical protein